MISQAKLKVPNVHRARATGIFDNDTGCRNSMRMRFCSQTCVSCDTNSNQHANITVLHAACKDAISAVDEMKSGTTGIDLDESDFLNASLQTYEAGDAALLGCKPEDSSLFTA